MATASQTAPDPADLQQKIERAKRELERMIDLDPQGMLLVDRDSSVVRANRALLELLGSSNFREVIHQRMEALFPCQDPGVFTRLISGSSGYESCEVPITPLAGPSRMLRFTAVNSGGTTDTTVVIVHDVTGEKEQALSLERQYKKEVVQALMGALMHHINQPLTVILVRAHLMRLAMEKMTGDSGELRRNLQDITELTLQIAGMLKNLETPRTYATQAYTPGVDILDLEKSSDPEEKWRSAWIQALHSLLAMVNQHDPSVASHCHRVAEYAASLGRHMGRDAATVDLLRRAGSFHDIGKVGIPDALLQKPTSLTEEEMATMRHHAEFSAALLQGCPSFQAEAAVVRAHHERWDGTGYPAGLAGTAIPFAARVIAVADAFDALRFIRFYHDPSPLDRVVDEIRAHSGTQFDPEVVEAFNTCYRDLDAQFSHVGVNPPL